MNRFVFTGRSRENRMQLVHDHHPTRASILSDAQERRRRREEEQRRGRAAATLQRNTRLLLARQAMLRRCMDALTAAHAQLAALLLQQQQSSLQLARHATGDESADGRQARHDATCARTLLMRAAYCYDYVQHYRHLLSRQHGGDGHRDAALRDLVARWHALARQLVRGGSSSDDDNDDVPCDTVSSSSSPRRAVSSTQLLAQLSTSPRSVLFVGQLLLDGVAASLDAAHDGDENATTVSTSRRRCCTRLVSLLHIVTDVMVTAASATARGRSDKSNDDDDDSGVLSWCVAADRLACACLRVCYTHLQHDRGADARAQLCAVVEALFACPRSSGDDDNDDVAHNDDNDNDDTTAIDTARRGCVGLSVSWSRVCWQLLCVPTTPMHLALTHRPVAALLSVRTSSSSTHTCQDATTNNDDDDVTADESGVHAHGDSSCAQTRDAYASRRVMAAHERVTAALVDVAYAALVRRRGADGSDDATRALPSDAAQRVHTSYAVLGRLVRLLPVFLDASSSSSSQRRARHARVLHKWLYTVAHLTQQLSTSTLFVDSILYDLHHSRTRARQQQQQHVASAASSSGGGSDDEDTRYRHLVSYLFSDEGGLRLLMQLSCADHDDDDDDNEEKSDNAAAWSQSALEVACSVYAWPLLSFVLAPSTLHRLETAALLAKLVHKPRLLQLLWRLYRDKCAGLRHALAPVATTTTTTSTSTTATTTVLDELCRQAMQPDVVVRLPHWLQVDDDILRRRRHRHGGARASSSSCASWPQQQAQQQQLRRNVFYDPHPALAVLFFVLLHYYVDVVDVDTDVQHGRVLTPRDLYALLLALKEVVLRAHMYGVVPHDRGSAAVAHVACLLLAKLHAINEVSAFVPHPSLWIAVASLAMLRSTTTSSSSLSSSLSFAGGVETVLSGAVVAELAEVLTRVRDDEERALATDTSDAAAPTTATTSAMTTSATTVARDKNSNNGDDNDDDDNEDVFFRGSTTWSPTERVARLLLHAPFLVPFAARAEVLTTLLLLQQSRRFPASLYDERAVAVRRSDAFGDAYARFRSAPDADALFHVRFVDDTGTLEAGYGHGVYRECLVALCRQGFAAEHGLFRVTDDGFLYPNPYSYEVTGDPLHLDKLAFLGAMTGRALRDGVVQLAPFAQHFCNALLGRRNGFTHLRRFDAQLHAQLLHLTTLRDDTHGGSGDEQKDGDADAFDSLGLTFTLTVAAVGVTREVELIKGGALVPVTRRNYLHYLHLVADYKLNREGAAQTRAFATGLRSIIAPQWLQLFDSNELVSLFCGDQSGHIDLDDWRAHTVYDHVEDAQSAPVQLFWRVVASLSAAQQRKLLQFATSYSRPPLLGFRFLSPPFHLMVLGDVPHDRLPSASTCFSLLKMPAYDDEATARAKIIAAIEETNTFELS